MKMYIAGQWVDRPSRQEIVHPYDGHVVDTVPVADADDVERALQAAVEGAKVMRALPAYDRYRILQRAARRVEELGEDLARTITLEEGKILAEARTEVARAVETLELSAEEARRIEGEVLPLDAAPGGSGRLGFTLRVPCGVVLAITPFNFPLNLVCHKVGPALAAGNAVIIKPASNTPLSALRLVEVLLEAGTPPLAIQCLVGPGQSVGKALCQDWRVRKISFTGSAAVGAEICRVAGVKRVTMELGSNSPLIIMPDADLEKVRQAVVATGYANAGQVCISTQRVLALRPVYQPLLEQLVPAVASLRTGDPMDQQTQVGPLVRQEDARRVEAWIQEAVQQGAKLLCGGRRRGSVVEPAVLADVSPEMKVSCQELFGPAVAVTPVDTVEQAIALANDSPYGLAAGIFTENLNTALRFAREVDAGNIQINWGPQWRADLMPYGGLKQSGFGKEGPRYAIREMTEEKTVVIHGLP